MLYCQCSEVSTTCLCITSMSRYSTQVTPTSIVNTQSMCRSGRRITPLLSCLPPSSSAPSWSTRWWIISLNFRLNCCLVVWMVHNLLLGNFSSATAGGRSCLPSRQGKGESQLRVTAQSHTSKLFNWTWEIWLNSLQTLIIKGPFWKKKKEIELEPNEANISSMI